MLIDEVQPDFDAARLEHRVVPGEPQAVYEIVLEADFIDAWKNNDAVRVLFALHAIAERLASLVRSPVEPAAEVASMRLAHLPRRGDWVVLCTDPPREIVFGAIGRFWAGETAWEEIDASEFAGFERPGFAKIACNFSLRPYGEGTTLVSYEARTRATDPAARRAFLRYWRVVSPFVGIVMRSMLGVIEQNARRPAASRARPRQ